MQPESPMKPIRSLFVLGLICLAISISKPAQAQTCNSNALAEACDFDSQPISLDWRNTEQGDISFRIISRKCRNFLYCLFSFWEAAEYTIEVSEISAGNNFFLSGSNGSVPISLSYSSSSVTGLPLLPNIQTSPINDGSSRHHEVYLTVSLTSPNAGAQLLAGSYSGIFQLTITQQGNCGYSSCASSTVSFAIELQVPANIRISGLDDIVINAPYEMEKDEDFCVFTQGGAAFGIKADSASGTGTFQLEGTNTGEKITYQTQVDTYPSSAPVILDEGIATPSLWAGSIYQNCNGGSNMRIIISLSNGALDDAVEGQYHDTLTLTVELE